MRITEQTLTGDGAPAWRMVLAGATVAVWVTALVLPLVVALGAIGGDNVLGGPFQVFVFLLLLFLPLALVTVLVIGVPLALLTERLCRRAGPGAKLAAFAVAGLVFGGLSFLLGTGSVSYTLLLGGALAAVAARALAGPLAARGRLLITTGAGTLLAVVASWLLVHGFQV